MTPEPISPDDNRRRRLSRFSRWLTAAEDALPAHRAAIVALARRIDLGGLGRADTLAAIDALDDLLAECWDRRPGDDD